MGGHEPANPEEPRHATVFHVSYCAVEEYVNADAYILQYMTMVADEKERACLRHVYLHTN